MATTVPKKNEVQALDMCDIHPAHCLRESYSSHPTCGKGAPFLADQAETQVRWDDGIGPCWKGLGSFEPFDVWLEFLIETNIAHENDGFPISDYGIRFWIRSLNDTWLKTGAVIPLRTVKIRKITCPAFTISQDP